MVTRRDTLKAMAGAILVTGFATNVANATSLPADETSALTLEPGGSNLVAGEASGTSQKAWTRLRLPYGAKNKPLYIRSQVRRLDHKTNLSALLYAENGKWRLQAERQVDGKTEKLWTSEPFEVKPNEQVAVIATARGDVFTNLFVEVRQSGASLAKWNSTFRTQGALNDSIGVASFLYLGRSAKEGLRLGDSFSSDSDTWNQMEPVVTGWGQPVFIDHFDGPSLDGSKWRVRDKTYVGYDWGYYKKENVTVRDSALVLSMREMDTPITTRDGRTRKYSQGYVDTIGKFSLENGRWEMRARIPASPEISSGLWGGFWLRPDDTTIQGEIDIAEAYGSKARDSKTSIDPSNRVEATCHFDQTGKNKANKMSPKGSVLKAEWHIYAVEKTPDAITFFFDGIPYHTVTKAQYGERFTKAFPPGAKWNIRLNFQAGNSYWGTVDETTDLSTADLLVDYIKVWDYKNRA